MRVFITRVELHGGSEDDYQTLHEAMEQRAFVRQILGQDGIWYHLPTATYYHIGNESPEEVRKQACDAAAIDLGKRPDEYCVLVTSSIGNYWVNLIPVRPQPVFTARRTLADALIASNKWLS